MTKSLLLLLSFILLFTITYCQMLDDGYSAIDVYTNCNELEDGYYDIEVIRNEVINIQCSNEYMIIDISHDKTWYNLLSSNKQYHENIIGPELNDHVNWDQFIPSLSIDHYLISPDCSQCDAMNVLNDGLYKDHSSYYMNQIANGCFHKNRGLPACDMDAISYECKICQWTEGTVLSRPYSSINDYNDDENTGICAFSIKPNDFQVATEFTQCFNYQYTAYKPSLGTNGRYCQCIKTDIKNDQHRVYRKRIQNEKNNEIQKQDEIKKEEMMNDIIYLYQTDFDRGTYRIQRGGTYIIMEDIEFDFNADINDPNSIGAYMPQIDQIHQYPGAGQRAGPYFLGFFSGITIETTDGVILDLNDHTIGMSKPYFFQQGFFSVIELGSQPFLPMHGPGNFGVNPVWAENVIIKNGIINRASHHGIHGNNNKNIEIFNIKVKQFVTHGIQLNGFSDITLKDIDIGPSNNMVKLNGNYIQMRALLSNLRTLYNKPSVKNKKFSFKGRKHDKMTLEELVEERLVPVMDEAFKLSVFDDYHIKNDDIADIVDKVFVNHGSDMIPYGAVVYGLFLNYPASGIFGWHVSPLKSKGAIIENVYVHDLQHHSEEMIGLTTHNHGISHAFNGPLSAISLVGDEMMEQISKVIETKSGEFHAEYIGDIVSDIHFAYFKFAYNDWDYWPGTPYYGDNGELAAWAFGDDEYYDNVISTDRIQSEDELNNLVTCNGDRMQHPLKGIIGIKISGVENIKFKGTVIVENLYDSSELGSKLCGPYTKANFGQQPPYSFGFSGNMVHAVDVAFSDIKFDTDTFSIKNIISDTGLSYGLSTWYDTQITFNDDVDFNIFNVKAGNKYLNDIPSDNEYRYKSPNHKPQACAIRIHQSNTHRVTFEFGDDDTIFQQNCIQGIVGCEEDTDDTTFPYTHIGRVNNKQCEDLRMPDFNGNNNNNQNNNNDDGIDKLNVNGKTIKGEEEEIIANVHYFGNVFIMAIISVLVLSVLTVYYCCNRDRNVNDEIDKGSSKWRRKDITTYGSL